MTQHDLYYSSVKYRKKDNIKYYFKKKNLPRVDKVISLLYGFDFDNILDIGSQRGSFIWKFIESFPNKKISTIDISEKYYSVHKSVLSDNAYLGDVRNLPFKDKSFDIITCLEVLEHVKDTQKVVNELKRVAKKYIVVSVPSKEDNNPEHIHYFTNKDIENMFKEYKTKFNSVLNHRIALIKL